MRPLISSPTQFALFRIIFGGYLFVHFAELWAWSPELFSSQGMFPDTALLPLHGYFPNLLDIADKPWMVQAMVALLALGSLGLALGWKRRAMALVLYFGWTCLTLRNPLIANPAQPYVGLCLLLSTLAPLGEGFSLDSLAPRRDWELPKEIRWVAFWSLMLGYSYSGYCKWLSPSWYYGDAFSIMLDNPLARGESGSMASLLPESLLRLMSWGVLAVELLAAPACLFGKRARFLVWAVLACMHFGIMVSIDFVDLTMGLLLAHLLAFDPDWTGQTTDSHRSIVFFDGDCGLCNSWVRWLHREDHRGLFAFAPLEGSTARHLEVPHPSDPREQGLAYWREGLPLLQRSDAVIAMLCDLGGIFSIAVLFRLVPRNLREAVYGYVALRRRRWFGGKGSCRLPEADEKSSFLS